METTKTMTIIFEWIWLETKNKKTKQKKEGGFKYFQCNSVWFSEEFCKNPGLQGPLVRRKDGNSLLWPTPDF